MERKRKNGALDSCKPQVSWVTLASRPPIRQLQFRDGGPEIPTRKLRRTLHQSLTWCGYEVVTVGGAEVPSHLAPCESCWGGEEGDSLLLPADSPPVCPLKYSLQFDPTSQAIWSLNGPAGSRMAVKRHRLGVYVDTSPVKLGRCMRSSVPGG